MAWGYLLAAFICKPQETFILFFFGIFEEDGGSYNTDESRGWVRLKLEKTSAQKDGLRIAEEFCTKRNLINYVHIDAEFNNWETW